MQSEFNSKKKNKDLPTLSIPSALHELMKKAQARFNSEELKLKQSDFIRLALEYFSKAILSGKVKKIQLTTTLLSEK